MDHIAIMVPDSRKVARGFKTIETRFAKGRSTPFDRVSTGDTIYFKDFGGPINVRASVRRVEYYEDLTPDDVEGLRRLHEKEIVADEEFWAGVKDKRYATLIFLNTPEPFPPYWPTNVPFNRSPWIVLDSPEKWDLWLDGLRKLHPHMFADQERNPSFPETASRA